MYYLQKNWTIFLSSSQSWIVYPFFLPVKLSWCTPLRDLRKSGKIYWLWYHKNVGIVDSGMDGYIRRKLNFEVCFCIYACQQLPLPTEEILDRLWLLRGRKHNLSILIWLLIAGHSSDLFLFDYLKIGGFVVAQHCTLITLRHNTYLLYYPERP